MSQGVVHKQVCRNGAKQTQAEDGQHIFPICQGCHKGCHIKFHRGETADAEADGRDGKAYLVINTSWTESTTVELPKEAELYALTGKTGMRSRTMCLNGKELVLSENDELPAMDGVTVPAGKIEVAPGSCAFIVL